MVISFRSARYAQSSCSLRVFLKVWPSLSTALEIVDMAPETDVAEREKDVADCSGL